MMVKLANKALKLTANDDPTKLGAVPSRYVLERCRLRRGLGRATPATTFHRVAQNCTGFHRIVTVVAERPSQVVDTTATGSRWHSRGHRFDPG